MNPFLAALASMEALNTTPARKIAERTTTKQELNPRGMSLRIFKDGRVFPSEELVEHFNLEYQTENEGNGLDVFLAHDLANFNKELPNAILVAPVAKAEAKVSLFKSTEFLEDGTPKASVLTQGTTTFGKDELIPMLETILETDSQDIFATQKYVDLTVETSFSLPLAGEFIYVPKTVSRGADKGKITLVRRGATTVHPVTINMATEITEDAQREIEVEEAVTL